VDIRRIYNVTNNCNNYPWLTWTKIIWVVIGKGGTIEKMSVCSALIKAYFFDKLGFHVKMQLTRAIGNETLIFFGSLVSAKKYFAEKELF